MADGALRSLALSLPGAWEDFPFSNEPVLKAGPKIFAFIPPDEPTITVKVDPDRGEALRGAYPGVVTFAPYLSKRHWVQIRCTGDLDPDEVEELLVRSYDLVVAGLTRAQRDALHR